MMSSYEIHTSLVVDGHDIDVDALDSLTLTIDEKGQDYLTLAASSSSPLPEAIDARTAPLLDLTAYTEIPDTGVRSDVSAWTLVLRSIGETIEPGSETYTLTGQSQESLVRDDNASVTREFSAGDGLIWALRQVLWSVIPGAPILVQIPEDTKFLEGAETLSWEPTTNPWALISAMCDAAVGIDVEVFHDGTAFVVRERPTLSTPAYYFLTGPGGNITKWSRDSSRDDFFNATLVQTETATVIYESPHPTLGVDEVGRKLRTETIGAKAMVNSALRRARSQTWRSIGSGLIAQLSTSELPLHLRPGMTVETDIRGELELWIISSIQVDLTAGGAHLTLRKDIQEA